MEITHLQWSQSSEQAVKARLDEFLRQDRSLPIDASQPGLLRFYTIDLGQQWLLVISSHHAVEDGWGFIGFKQRLWQRYKSLINNNAQLNHKGQDNSVKQYGALQKLSLQLHEKSWRQKMARFQPMPALPMIKVPEITAHPKIEPDVLSWRLGSESFARFKAYARDHHLNVKSVFAALFCRALGEHIKIENVCIDVVTNGRSPQLDNPFEAMGLFWSFLPLMVRIDEHTNAHTNSYHMAQLIADVDNDLKFNDSMAHFPASKLCDWAKVAQLTYAAFNFVNFSAQTTSDRQSDSDMSVVAASDRFHHSVKFLVAVVDDENDAQLSVEINPADCSFETAKTLQTIINRLIQSDWESCDD